MSDSLHVLVTGAAGMIGQKLMARFAREPRLGGKPIERMTLVDVEAPNTPKDAPFKVAIRTGDLSLPGEASARRRPATIRLSSRRRRLRRGGDRPRQGLPREHRRHAVSVRCNPQPGSLQAAPRVHEFGCGLWRPFDGPVTDDFHLTPHSSYGVAKAIGEQLLADYSRRGFFDGVGIRLPAITVRPGKPNKAASGFFSSIIREPLAGQNAMLPVPEDTLHSHASPRAPSAISCMQQRWM